MIQRYANKKIDEIWSDMFKLNLWQKTELMVLKAKASLGYIQWKTYEQIKKILETNPINVEWWLQRDKEIHHDLNAFIDERLRFLPESLQVHFHKKITSFDTEEAPFASMLIFSIICVDEGLNELSNIIVEMAKKYRYTIMNGRTHGQEAEMQTFGKRCLTWLQDLRVDNDNLKKAATNLKYSKLSGAIGNYGSIDPEVEKRTLELLGFDPYYGATQIMPRELYAPIAQALCQVAQTVDKIATAIRLGARSSQPIFQEPFAKKQKGSSAMPHKKNTIRTEQIEGMARMAKGYFIMIMDNIKTWEERAIEQSCVERVAWPDLFHTVIRSIDVMKKVLSGLMVYPDNMLLEIVKSRGCYASSEAKEIIRELGAPVGLTTNEAYRIVQLAAFNIFEKGNRAKKLRKKLSQSLDKADDLLDDFEQNPESASSYASIKYIIPNGELRASEQLDAAEEDIKEWNATLKVIFGNQKNLFRWYKIFRPSYLLRNEQKLYQEILGE